MIKTFGHDELEKIADDFLKKHGKYDGRALRLEQAIESFGYRIHPVPNLVEIAEAYIPIKKGYIFVDEDQYLDGNSFRWRFTLAEELAHALIHIPLFDGMSTDEINAFKEQITDGEYLSIERDAKYLAGCILMPKNVFVNRFEWFTKIQSSNVSNELKLLRFVVRQLNLDFNVSAHSIALRALKLDLIDQKQFDDLMDLYNSYGTP